MERHKYLKYKTKYLMLVGGKRSKHKRTRKNKSIMNVSEPWFSLISLGIKTVEGRLNKGRFRDIREGDIIEWVNDDFNHRSVMTKITKKIEYETFEEYLQTEGLENCLPTIGSIEDGVNVYRKYYSEEKEREYGVLALRLEIIN